MLGSDGGVAVVHGGDGPPQESHHTEAFPVSWMGWALCLLSVMSSIWSFYFLLCQYPFYSSPRSSCTGGCDLGGIYQGKGIRNTKLVSTLLYRFTPPPLQVFMRGYCTWLGVCVCSIINLSLCLSHLSFTIPFLVVQTLIYLSPHSVPPPPSSMPYSNIISFHIVFSCSSLVVAGCLWKEAFSMHLLDLLQLLSWYFLLLL